MKNLPIIIFLLLSTFSFSQDTIVKKYKTGQIASREIKRPWPQKDMTGYRDESVEVFNKKGEKVFTGNRRNYAGHSSVYLEYHKNGGVKKITTSDAPDAGIQWYKSWRELDEEGNVIHFTEDNHDKMHTTPIYFNPEFNPPSPVVKKQDLKPNECAAIMQSNIVFINKSKSKVEVLIVGKSGQLTGKTYQKTLKPNDTTSTENYTNAQKFAEAKEIADLFVKKGKKLKLEKIDWQNLPFKTTDKGGQIRTYHFYWVD